MAKHFYPYFNIVTGLTIVGLGFVIFREGQITWQHYKMHINFEGSENIFGPLIIVLGLTMLFYGVFGAWKSYVGKP